jgi:hypothetical protein
MINEDKRVEIGGWATPFKNWRDEQKHRRSMSHYEKNGEKQEISEEEQAQATARKTRSEYLPCHYFDYIGGTSTGG